MQQLAAFPNQPVEAGNLRQASNGRQNNGKLRHNNAQAKHAHHCGGDQPGQCAEGHHNAAEKPDPSGAFQKGVSVDAPQGGYDSGEEGHQQIDHRLDQCRQIARQAVDDFDQELHDRIHDLRRIGRQRRKDSGNQLQSPVGNRGHTLHQDVHQGEHQRFDRVSNRRGAIGDDSGKGDDRLAQLLGNRRD